MPMLNNLIRIFYFKQKSEYDRLLVKADKVKSKIYAMRLFELEDLKDPDTLAQFTHPQNMELTRYLELIDAELNIAMKDIDAYIGQVERFREQNKKGEIQ